MKTADEMLADTVDWIEQNFRCVDGAAAAYNENGDIYVSIVSSGEHREERMDYALYLNAAAAVRGYDAAIRTYLSDKTFGSTLHWRMRPHICEDTTTYAHKTFEPTYKPLKVFTVYSRLVVTP